MKKVLTFLIISVLLVSTVVIAAPLFKVKTANTVQSTQDYVEGQILVKFKDGVDDSKIINSFSSAVIGENTKGGFKYLTVPSDKTVEEMVAKYSSDPNVVYAEPNYILRSYMVPNDPYYVYQWHMPMINMEQAWDNNTGSGVIVAILDVGVAYEDYGVYGQAPDLAQTNFVPGYDFINNDTHPNDDNGHGTHVCGTIAQSTNNNLGVTGIAYNSSIMPVKVLDASGSGATDVIANGIYYAADNGAQVINMSLGSSYFSSTINDACNYAKSKGVTIICAAGNSGQNILEYPAANTACVSVSAVRFDSTLAGYSTYNDSVDITAPGGDTGVDQDGDGYVDGVLQQTHDGTNYTTFSYYFYQGTSMASPHVAGVAALVISASGGTLTPDEVQTILQNSAVDLGSAGWDNRYGYGLLDANAAVLSVASNTNPPVADFSGTPTSGTEPLTVSFTDLSTNNPTAWSWDFGDGGTSTSQNPSYTYNTAGTYTVALTATNAYGSNTQTKVSYITVNACVTPTAGFVGTPTSGDYPLAVSFTDQSSGATSYSWDFGDGGTSTVASPSHTYNAAGTYSVTQTVTNSCGSDPLTRTNYITVTTPPCDPPVASFSGTPTSGDYPLTVNFTDASTFSPTSWSWDFGDGGTSTLQNPSYTYTAAGTYSVSLTATNSCGSDIATQTNYITVTTPPCDAPVASFSGTPTSGNTPLTVNFTDASTFSPTSWSWTFGDGGTSTVQNPSYTYSTAGTYSVSLTATNSCGSGSVTQTSYITVTDPPVGGFCDDFQDGDISNWSILSGTWTVSGGQLDGTIASGKGFIMSPAGSVADGSITVDWTSLTGGTWTNGIVVFGYIDANNYRVADFRDGANKWYIREFVGGTQSNKASFAETINTNQQYAMEVVIDPSGLVTVSADGVQKVSYNFGNVQTGLVGLEVNQSHSQFDNFCVNASTPAAPTADFSGTPTSGTTPLSVVFTDLSTGSPTSWSWTFGDGGTSTAQNPSYTYNTAGTYTVELTATNAQGSDVNTKTGYITVTDAGTWTTITYDDFEAGWGTYTDGGGDCSRYTGGTYAAQGSAAIDIQDNSGVASSFYHTNGYDVSGYQQLEVVFKFYAVSMDNSNEDFWVQYFDGSSWITLAAFAQGIDFNNNTFYTATVTWNTTQVTFPTNAKLRFMCDASGNWDDVYIDAIDFHGTTTAAASVGGPIMLSSTAQSEMFTELVPGEFELNQNYPNPFNPTTSIAFSLPQADNVRLTVYNVLGQEIAVLADRQFSAGNHTVEWDASNVSSGMYLYRIETSNFTSTKKMLLLK